MTTEAWEDGHSLARIAAPRDSARWARITLAAALALATGGGVSPQAWAGPGGADMSGRRLARSAGEPILLSGWLHVIWNGAPRFVLVDDQGAATQLVIDDALGRPFGGLRALSQKRVRIVGERVSERPDAVRVLTIELGTESK